MRESLRHLVRRPHAFTIDGVPMTVRSPTVEKYLAWCEEAKGASEAERARLLLVRFVEADGEFFTQAEAEELDATFVVAVANEVLEFLETLKNPPSPSGA